ncbi:hypothetical protein FB45DRAFT_887486 [Roridomyces roridus]|uniref:CipC protein n=1 Tax=Roridomyces roridus TaxID=1738132 RepID=A0AAD7CJ26_9AGAR|nr:hypothetical protein FB45DRAFT_887486 [Roridomyces roridus]
MWSLLKVPPDVIGANPHFLLQPPLLHIMGFFSNDSSQADAYNQLQSSPHKSEMSHELLAGAASFFAARELEKHMAANGKPTSHAETKALLAGFAGAFIDKEVETRGLDFIDKEKAKHDAHNAAADEVIVEDF